jgi:hypothetical protein
MCAGNAGKTACAPSSLPAGRNHAAQQATPVVAREPGPRAPINAAGVDTFAQNA